MEKYYFVTVRTYQSVNNMGLELGKYVEEKYDKVVMPAGDFGRVQGDILEKMKELEKKYPRSRAFKMETLSLTDILHGKNAPSLYVKPQNKYNDNHIFVLDAFVIRNKISVISTDVKGGEV